LEHLFFLNGAYGAGGHGNSGGHTKGVVCEAKLTKKITRAQDCRNCRWTIVPSGREAHPSFLNIEKRLGGITLSVDVLLLPIAQDLSPQAGSGGEISKL
jgi:hypothetical protein